ncbi:MAG: stage V sporulation protein S, partial [Coriobacteriaceae bacterium]|nr:stage V sporulation protein S [Coriobacteriaceae bacterium]
IKDGNAVNIQSVGAGAVNQAIKAIAIARGYLAPSGIDLSCTPSFSDITIDGHTRTAIRLTVNPSFQNVPTNSTDQSIDYEY